MHEIGIDGERLRARRKQLGLVQKDLSDAAGYNGPNMISDMERGARANLPLKRLIAIAVKLTDPETGEPTSIGWLFGEGPDDLYDHGDTMTPGQPPSAPDGGALHPDEWDLVQGFRLLPRAEQRRFLGAAREVLRDQPSTAATGTRMRNAQGRRAGR